jgi:hypothetical protein
MVLVGVGVGWFSSSLRCFGTGVSLLSALWSVDLRLLLLLPLVDIKVGRRPLACRIGFLRYDTLSSPLKRSLPRSKGVVTGSPCLWLLGGKF